jgi:uncharacterized protein
MRKPWLVAAWPGLASVGALAVRHLALTAGGRNVLEVDPVPWFDGARIQVRGGIVRASRGPRTTFHEVLDAAPSGRDLVVLVAESQPPARTHAFAETVLDAASAFGVSRVVTFAAMAAPLDPSEPARTFAASTTPAILAEAERAGAVPLEGGEIAGMNGALVGAAARRGFEGLCLLGEFPYFAGGIPNPKAAAAVLRTFGRLRGAPVDVAALEEQARAVDRELTSLLDRFAHEGVPTEPEELATPERERGDRPPAEDRATAEAHRRLSSDDVESIERLFDAVDGDREKALALKTELDRLGVFRQYEDRFLDLFRRAE